MTDIRRTILWVIFGFSLVMLWDQWQVYNGRPATFFPTKPAQTAKAPDAVTMRQGALEASNVQPVVEISKMIEVMRAYEATATLSKSQEDMMRQAIDRLGQMPA